MFVNSLSTRARRRGVVLILVLGMLGLLALIGVTFATFSNQAQISARSFSQAASFPDANEVMDYALQQLISDTTNPQSVIRGHSLKRDMYGNDALNNGYLANMPDGSTMQVSAAVITSFPNTNPLSKLNGTLQVTTNIPGNGDANYGQYFYNYDFTRWVMKFPQAQDNGTGVKSFWVGRTHEILYDDPSGATRVFYVAIPTHDLATNVPAVGTNPANVAPSDPTITGYASPELNDGNTAYTSGLMVMPPVYPSTITGYSSVPFVLDGRYLRAFNGSGISGTNFWGLDTAGLSGTPPPLPHPLTEWANFRYNGNIFLNVWSNANNPTWTPSFTPLYGDPNDLVHCPSMDEDYDACDLENWFLAMQSADGKVVIPSFHRPGIVAVNPTNALDNDWTRTIAKATTPAEQLIATRAMSRILRPRQADGHSPISFPDLTPDAGTGQINYDVDNDGDGVRDSVWLDLGYPAKRGADGRLFKPLFSFMVIGLNGRLPLNTAGNLADRNDTTLVQLADHTDHLGTSPSEIDLRYALQNAYDENNPNAYNQYDNAMPMGSTTAGFPYTYPNPAASPPLINGASVAQTQLRNLLTGTRPAGSGNDDANFVYAGSTTPIYLPNNVADNSDTNVQGTSPSFYIYRQTPAISGRWGESGVVPGFPGWNPVPTFFNNPIRAGFSVIQSQNAAAYDARDDNYNTFDFNGETADYYDASGSIALPVERIRRFVNPTDPIGDGLVVTYGTYPRNRTNGGDLFGRVNFLGYFRPPGIPLSTFNGTATPYNQPAALGQIPTWVTSQPIGTPATNDVRTNNLYHGFSTSLSPNPGWAAAPNPPGTAAPTQDTSGKSPLAFAGMPSDQGVTPAPATSPATITAVNTPLVKNVDPTVTWTYSISPGINSNGFFPSPALNEADEMDLYSRSELDAPFGPSDLEWLYRLQDVDGPSLHSRLSLLAPVSFLNLRDGTRRRRLFALESWEPTSFVWANDNPQGVFPNNSRFTPTANASFMALNNVSPVVARNTFPNPVNLTPNPDPAADNSAQHSSSGSRFWVDTPSLAHRDRKINLNFPLPVSNSQVEPVRQKWIRETYQLLKAILPPKAVDTPEELAELSQYVVNIIDFRDPDCTMTRFVNTDLLVVEPTGIAAPNVQASLLFSSYGNPTGTPAVAAAPAAIAYNPAYTVPANAATHYLVQYGMEYPPVAINEVLAYQFQTKIVATNNTSGDPNNNVARMYVELVNTLTKDAIANNTPDTADLDLTGWDFVVQPDDNLGRPDPFTGQIPVQPAGQPAVVGVPLSGGQPGSTVVYGPLQPPIGALGSSELSTAMPATTPTVFPPDSVYGSPPPPSTPTTFIPYYYVFGNSLPSKPTAASGSTTPNPPLQTTDNSAMENLQPVPSTTNTTAPTTATGTNGYVDLTPYLKQRANVGTLTNAYEPGQYYWLYLRRPANPFDTAPGAERVVVDTFRFVFIASQGKGYTVPANPPTTPKQYDTVAPAVAGEYIFSLQRLQPFRGGHAVPVLGATTQPAGTPATVIPAYGYSEQTVPTPTGATSNTYGYWGKDQGGNAVKSTGQIRHTMNAAVTGSTGLPYGSTSGRNNPSEQVWDYLPFNDRDFTSVIELLMVPGCPPGLFTKQFVELPPPFPASYADLQARTTNPTLFDSKTSTWTNSPWASGAANPAMLFATNAGSHTFPYLNDEFFYTAVSEPATFVASEATRASTPPAYFRSAVGDANTPSINNYVGGPSGAGWFKMFDFFEVPSPAFKAIGEVAQGINYDWARQDLKPGLININLIIDEEVFLGVMGSGLTKAGTGQNGPTLNMGQIGMPGSTSYAKATTPSVVTQLDDTGAVFRSYNMPYNSGAFDPVGFVDPLDGATYPNFNATGNAGNGRMKASFADFLSLRHGGSGNLFAFSTSAPERPFHSLSYPDINYTILRPACLPPPTPSPAYPWLSGNSPVPAATSPLSQITWDPGIKNPYLYTSTVPVQPPPIPPRRLFQVPDAWGSPSPVKNAFGEPPVAYATGSVPSNASVHGDANANIQVPLASGLAILNTNTKSLASPPYPTPMLTAYPDLTTTPPATGTDASSSNKQYQNSDLVSSEYLGGNNYGSAAKGLNVGTGPPAPGATNLDQSDHPYFRYEWLQKVANLTTVRTHQYAVWITVGFFEVTYQGNPQFANNPTMWSSAYDTLGEEVGLLDGKNVRYRGFFLLDRTRAVGFNPSTPGDFRDCVTYRQLIE